MSQMRIAAVDPLHLTKKLRNNLHSSGFTEKNRCYTQTLHLNGKYILWDHIYSVYTRDLPEFG